ncbi:hypothetical protein LXL04_038188 [Taraxacum kok-saghyz]
MTRSITSGYQVRMDHSMIVVTKRQHISVVQRRAIYEALLQASDSGELEKGAISTVASHFSVSKRTVSRIWHQAKSQTDHGLPVDLSSNLAMVVGRKRVQVDLNQVLDIPLRRRTNIRSLANCLNVSKSTMYRRIKEGALRPHTNAVKPTLTHENKRARLEFYLSKISWSLSSQIPTFHDMFNAGHIDEKWFYLSKPSRRYYLLPSKDEPLRTCQSKKFITKVMFLADVARPRFDASGKEIFSGKIGELVHAVETSFERMESQQLNNVFLTLQTCMKEIIKVQVGNNYQIPHIGKNRLVRERNLPLQIECDQNLIDEALLHLAA